MLAAKEWEAREGVHARSYIDIINVYLVAGIYAYD